MSKIDFSHLFQVPSVVAGSLTRGYRVEDENWLGTVRRLEPPLFDDAELKDLKWILNPAVERRGGKSIKSLSAPLITRLEKIERPGLAEAFVAGLIDRLQSGKRYTRIDSDRAYGLRTRKSKRDQLIVYFYDYIYERLEADRAVIEHDVFDAIPVSSLGSSRGEKTIATLHDFLCDRTIIDPPSEGTLLKIVSEDKNRKRHRKS